MLREKTGKPITHLQHSMSSCTGFVRRLAPLGDMQAVKRKGKTEDYIRR